MGLENTAPAVVADADQAMGTVKTAVILAAGNGSRLQIEGKIVPKPLIKVGGLHLIERAILNLHAAGIERFRVVVGAYRSVVIDTVKNLKSLRRIPIEFIECPDYEQGNGISLAAGAANLTEPFVVAMADHVMSPHTVTTFITATNRMAHLPLLGTDPNLAEIMDLDDATKVATNGNRIAAIGKELPHYNQIDIGLFYFPAGAGATLQHHAAHGAKSVSALVQRMNQADGFFTVSLPSAVWQDVDTPEMAKEAERRLVRDLRKPTDGPVSRWCNRTFSLPISRLLVHTGISPNVVTTFVFLLTLVAAGFVASTNYLYIAFGGIVFQLASILDGCDGELSRLTLRGSKFGAWYDTITDNVRYLIFLICMGISAYRTSGNPAYVWALVAFCAISIFFATKMARITARAKKGTNLVVTAQANAYAKTARNWWDRFAFPQRVLIKQDVSAVMAMVCALIGKPGYMFWFSCYAVVVMTISLLRTIAATTARDKTTADAGAKSTSFVFLLIGSVILGVLLSRMPVGYIWTSLATVGGKIWLVFAVAPIWFAFNTLSLWVLIGNRISFVDLFYNQLVGEAINTIVPLAGLAGEPYKIKHLANWIPLGDASRAIVQNKIIHAISGPLFSGLCCLITLAMIPLERKIMIPLGLVGGGMISAAAIFTLVAFSKAPERITAFVLTRLKFLGAYQQQQIDPKLFVVSLLHKMIGRTINLLEVVIILYLLGLPFSIGEVVAIEAFVTATAVVFVVVPQGLGVNEAGIAGAFALLGFPAALAMSFGIIRRARVVFWAIGGLVVHLIVTLIQQATRAVTESAGE